MKATKFIVLIAGLVGAAAFFLPFVAVDEPQVQMQVSAFELVKGLDLTSELSGYETEIDPDVTRALSEYKYVVIAAYLPAVFLVLLGLIGTAGRFGRALGLLALLMGIAGLGIYALGATAAGSLFGLGFHLLVVPGIVGFVGGLVALIKPELSREMMARHASTLRS